MQEALTFLNQLSDEDIEILFNLGSEQQTIANTRILTEGEISDTVYIVLEGLVGVSAKSLPNRQLARLGPGELVGEISFLEQKPAIATVTVIENTLLLAIPAEGLRQTMEKSPEFGSRMYRSLALLSAARLRNQVSSLDKLLERDSGEADIDSDLWSRVKESMSEFKQLMSDCDAEALENRGEISENLRKKTIANFTELAFQANQLLGEDSPLSETVKNDVGAKFKQELLPYLLLTKTAERFYSKPRGYAGDYLTIEMIYQDNPGGSGRLGPLLDECFLNMPAALAVQNRRGLLREEITHVRKNKPTDGPVKVTSMAAGPAAELFDVFEELENVEALKATCIDIDLQALAFVADRRDQRNLRRQMELLNSNLVYLALGRQELNLDNQDLVYSIGLIDYFADKFVIQLLNYVHGILSEGGKVVLGNFHPRNRTKALMDHVLDWKLIHRNEDDMNRLFEASMFGRPCTDIRFEEQGVNLFASCTKQ